MKPRGNRWTSVIGSMLALVTNGGVTLLIVFSLFVTPLATEFGWSRSSISAGFSIAVVMVALMSPYFGHLMDRYGTKRVWLWSVALYAVAIAGISQGTTSLVTFWVFYGLAGLVAAGNSPMPAAKIVSGWFDDRRGLALGIAMAGTGLGAALIPQIVRFVIENHGWRLAYLAIGGLTLLFGFLSIALLVRNPPASQGNISQGTEMPLSGLTLGEAIRTGAFWIILSTVVLLTILVNGITAHLVPMLTDRGIPGTAAAAMLAPFGIALLIGRFFTGMVFDYVFGPLVTGGICIIAAAGAVLLASGLGSATPLIAVICIGFATGAEIDAIGYLTGRYFGLKNYAAIYGFFFASFAFAAGLGPFLLGLSFDQTHSYDNALYGFIVAQVLAVVLLTRLGPYRFKPVQDRERLADSSTAAIAENR